ncbi:hypothetical protein BVRB_5g116900 [Beta vulgaris subsp. vulgaris]|nr:hypothetical protein BVRB_5g116900 [Beta vulgaris subsp. vulgaris]
MSCAQPFHDILNQTGSQKTRLPKLELSKRRFVEKHIDFSSATAHFTRHLIQRVQIIQSLDFGGPKVYVKKGLQWRSHVGRCVSGSSCVCREATPPPATEKQFRDD